MCHKKQQKRLEHLRFLLVFVFLFDILFAIVLMFFMLFLAIYLHHFSDKEQTHAHLMQLCEVHFQTCMKKTISQYTLSCD